MPRVVPRYHSWLRKLMSSSVETEMPATKKKKAISRPRRQKLRTLVVKKIATGISINAIRYLFCIPLTHSVLFCA